MPDYNTLIGAFRDDTEGPPRRARAPVARRSGRPVVVVGVALAAAAALLVRTAPLPETPLPPGPLGTGLLTDEVALQVDGIGTAGGTRTAPRLEWEGGRLGVEVTPQRGIALSVHTAEATVEVVGTGFDVRRDPLGTGVDVRHGRVLVTCTAGGSTLLTEGDARTCPPVTAAGLLGRVRALQARGAPYGDEAAAALARPDATGAVAHELKAARLDALLSAGDPAAFAIAEEVAADAGARSLEAHRIAARLAGDCTRARPHLAALAEADALGADRPAWEACAPEASDGR